MDDLPDDAALLQQYVAGDRAIFEQLVHRHVNFVYATARRQVGESHLADDVTQAVFLVLAAKAATLSRYVVLVGWLYQTTLYVAANALKKQRRREHHERAAAWQRSEHAMAPEPADPDALRRLDAALAALPAKSRDALLLRFFPQRPLAEVGRALGISEEAAKKRVARAIDALRDRLVANGGAPSIASTVALLDNVPAISAPTSLQAAIIHPAAGAAAAQALAKGALVLMTAKQVATAVAIAAALLVSGASIVASLNVKPPAPSAAKQSLSPATGPATPLIATVSSGTVELLAVGSPQDNGRWWTPAGDADLPQPYAEARAAVNIRREGRVNRGFIYRKRFEPNDDASMTVRIAGQSSAAMASATPPDPSDEPMSLIIANIPEATPATMRLELATGPWTVLASQLPSAMTQPAEAAPHITFEPLRETEDGRTEFAVTILQPMGSAGRRDIRLIAVTRDGREHAVNISTSMSQNSGMVNLKATTGQVRAADIATVRLETRPFNEWVEFRNLAIERGQVTTPTTASGRN